MDFLQLAGKKVLIFGIANRRSVAFHIARTLRDCGAEIICSVFEEEQEKTVKKYFPEAPVYQCDVSDEEQMARTAELIGEKHGPIYGIVHSVAFANFSEGLKPFHETGKADFLQACDISCYSFISMAKLYKPYLEKDGAMVTISISTCRMAAENYGYMAPIKAALNSSIAFLAKSLSADSRVRVNGVGASLLKTSASAGIPGYIAPYLFAEQATLRKEALKTEEVADTAVFLLSPRASGINAQTVVVDAGMSVNFFDKDIVSKVVD
jgi:enoyl-[acyl-carrier protein] reductase I